MKKAKLTKAEERLLSELSFREDGPKELVVNPYSGRGIELEPAAVALYDFIKGCEMTGNWKDFDRGRYLFAKLWPEAYMTLLD